MFHLQIWLQSCPCRDRVCFHLCIPNCYTRCSSCRWSTTRVTKCRSRFLAAISKNVSCQFEKSWGLCSFLILKWSSTQLRESNKILFQKNSLSHEVVGVVAAFVIMHGYMQAHLIHIVNVKLKLLEKSRIQSAPHCLNKSRMIINVFQQVKLFKDYLKYSWSISFIF